MLAVLYVLGLMLMMFSVTYLLPIATSIIYADGQLFDFAVAALACLAAGLLTWALTRRHQRELRSREASCSSRSPGS